MQREQIIDNIKKSELTHFLPIVRCGYMARKRAKPPTDLAIGTC